MIVLSVIAGCVIFVAAAVFRCSSFEIRTADQRGITLQTLIVTAVLVLMAGAAGVVIIAITNNARDNLEAQDTGIQSRCEPWEIFDPSLSAAGRGAENGGIDSSKIGCVRVCYVRFTPATAWSADPTGGDFKTKHDSTGTDVDLKGTKSATTAELRFSRSDEFDGRSTAGNDVTFPVSGDRQLDGNGNANTDINLAIKKISGVTTVDNFVIKVAANQRYCHVWDTTTDTEKFRSKN